MRKALIAGLAALVLAGSQATFAEPAAPEAAMREQDQFSEADLKAFTDARVAALKAGLQLNAEQEKSWPPVEQAIRSMAEATHARWQKAREEAKSQDDIALLNARAAAMEQRAAELKKLTAAAEPLYRTLTDDQKRRLHAIMHMMMGHMMMEHMMMEDSRG